MERNDLDLCLAGSSVTATSPPGSHRRTSSQPRGSVAGARSQQSLVSVDYSESLLLSTSSIAMLQH